MVWLLLAAADVKKLHFRSIFYVNSKVETFPQYRHDLLTFSFAKK